MVTRTKPHNNVKQRTTKRYEASTLTYKDYIGNPVFNHKVEQVVRALLVYVDVVQDSSLYNPSAVGTSLTCDLRVMNPDSHLCIGKADHTGYKFYPETNALLASLGYNANVLLYTLSTVKDLEGQYVLTATKCGALYITPDALMLCAYDLVFNYTEAYKFYKEYRDNHKGNPKNILAI